jgi:hypothetical protein
MQPDENNLQREVSKMVIKGKYLAAIREYVASLSFNEDILIKINPQFDALQSAMLTLKGEYLNRDSANAVLFRECYSFAHKHQGRTGPLNTPDNQDLLEGMVNHLKACIESYPRDYVVRIELPSFPNFGAATFDLAPDMMLAIGQHKRDSQNAIVNALLKTRGVDSVEFDAFIELRASGYADNSPDSAVTSACISMAKQCAFILLAFGVVKNTYAPSEPARATLTTKLTGTTNLFALPDSLARYLGTLVPNDEKLVTYDYSSAATLLGAPPRPAAIDEEKCEALRSGLSTAVRYFSAKENTDFASISAAIDWYQDSLLAENQTFSYVAACIGMEALLGSDTHIDEMSKRLADRYAFLMGKGRAEREALSSEYTKILKLRGRLVHAKAARLEGNDRDLLRSAQQMLMKAIWHELHEMYRQKQS